MIKSKKQTNKIILFKPLIILAKIKHRNISPDTGSIIG